MCRLVLFSALLVLLTSVQTRAEFDVKAKTAILIDVGTGSVLFAKKPDQLTAPASMSKLMTLAVLFDALKTGRISLEDKLFVSEHAWRDGGFPSGTSAMGLKLNSRETVENLIRGIVVQSGNDACIVVAEGLAGSEGAFADLMNAYGKKIGLEKSYFVNATGLPDPDHLMTPRELARLAMYIIDSYPEYYKYFSELKFKYSKYNFSNRNPLVHRYGADGLKTGYTKASGYGLVASISREGRRLVAVLNGMKSKKERSAEGRKLLEWGFRSFRLFTLFGAGEVVGTARVWGGKKRTVPLTGGDTGAQTLLLRTIPMRHNKIKAKIVYDGPLKPPVKKGDHVADLEVSVAGKLINNIPLYAAENVEKAGYLWQGVSSLVFLIFRGYL